MASNEQLLHAAAQGDRQAAAELLPVVYDELRKLATYRLANEASGQTLQPTALVHEVYLRLVGAEDARRWDGKRHFFAAAAEAMRRILIENARRKRGPTFGGRARVAMDLEQCEILDRHEDLLAMDEALDQLALVDGRAAEVVKLRFYSGLTIPEVGAVLGISARTADADWAYARAWLMERLSDDRQ